MPSRTGACALPPINDSFRRPTEPVGWPNRRIIIAGAAPGRSWLISDWVDPPIDHPVAIGSCSPTCDDRDAGPSYPGRAARRVQRRQGRARWLARSLARCAGRGRSALAGPVHLAAGTGQARGAPRGAATSPWPVLSPRGWVWCGFHRSDSSGACAVSAALSSPPRGLGRSAGCPGPVLSVPSGRSRGAAVPATSSSSSCTCHLIVPMTQPRTDRTVRQYVRATANPDCMSVRTVQMQVFAPYKP
jgi:hypothetical protein